MGRFTAALASILASLGLAGLAPDGPDASQPPPESKTKRGEVSADADDRSYDPKQAVRSAIEALEDLKRAPVTEETRRSILQSLLRSYEAALADADDGNPATVLQQTYPILQRLRAERLDGQPRELLDRAVELYKRAVELADQPGLAAQREAWGLAVASREVAHAVERLRDAQRAGKTDPYLPPPPSLERRSLTVRAVPAAPSAPLPPPIPPGPADVVVQRVPPMPPAPPTPPVPPGVSVEAPRQVLRGQRDYVVVTPGPSRKDGQSRSIQARIFVTPEGDAVKGDAENPTANRYRFELDGIASPEELQKKLAEVRAQAEAAREQALKAQNEALAQQKRTMEEVVIHGPGSMTIRAHSPQFQARMDLQRAYDRISAARKAAGDDNKGRFYLDSARDLYNAARRDAEAGRHERASELARAAEALTLVPQNLPGAADAPANVRIESRVIVRDTEKAKPPEEAKSPDSPPTDPFAKPEDRNEQNDAEDGTAIEGIGAALGMEDGHVVVRKIVPDSPAARDGRLQEGDILVGVQKEGDEKVLFKGKELAEIVTHLRGEADSTVKVIVTPKGQDDTVTYELKRARVPVPPRPANTGAPLPPALPED